MRGFVAYTIGVAAVAALIPWPELLPASLIAIVAAWALSNPRTPGGKLTNGEER